MAHSESYEEVLNAACMAWRSDMPHDDRIIQRYLVRDEPSDNGSIVVRILPCRFVELAREASSVRRLELRLELKTRSGEPNALSILELPPAMISPAHTNNPQSPSSEELRVRTAMDDPHVSNPTQEPLTPDSMPQIVRPGLAPPLAVRSDDPNPMNITQNPVRNTDESAMHDDSRNPAYDNGLSAFSAGRYHDALIHFQDATDYFREKNNSRQEAECLTHLGVIYRYNKEYSNARSHFSSARTIYEGLGRYREKQLQCERQLAQVDERAGDFPKALRAFENIRTIARNEGFRKQEAWCAYSMGRLHNEIRLYDKALGHLKDAIEIAQALQNLDSKLEIEAFASEESGRSEELRGNKSEAIEHYEWARRQFVAGGRGRWTADENRIRKKVEELRRKRDSVFGFPVGLFKRRSHN